MMKTLKFNRPTSIARIFCNPNFSSVVDAITFRPRGPGDKPDDAFLVDVIARVMFDEDGNSLSNKELRQYALAEGIKAAFRPFFESTIDENL